MRRRIQEMSISTETSHPEKGSAPPGEKTVGREKRPRANARRRRDSGHGRRDAQPNIANGVRRTSAR
eukprot:15474119-Alexandrium_andersonii.AAC.1